MQSWTARPTQCIFCSFRQSIFHAPSRYPGLPPTYRQGERGFSSARPSFRQKHRSRERPQTDGERDKRIERDIVHSRSRAQNNRRHDDDPTEYQHFRVRRTSSSRLPPHLHHHGYSEEQQRAAVKKKIEDALIAIKARISAQEDVQDGQPQKPSVLQRLDPDGTKWPAFCQSIFAEARPETNEQKRAVNPVSKRLLAARSLTIADVEQEVYFDFLDFALQHSDGSSFVSQLPMDLRYPTEWYSHARSQQRVIHLHVGPTNSGKTYTALKRLQEAKNGFYAGPLRLLAHEVYSRFRANGIGCDLITGDDVRLDDSLDTSVYASTVEMVQASRYAEVAVIDEIQMMCNEERGWAWTRAFLGANAQEVHLCGETRVIPIIRELAASMGDTLHIHHYERLNPLRATTKSLRGNLKLLRKGDCIVAFSIMQIHALKKQIEVETGRRCAIVYGSLPPETRAEQADLFNDPDNDYDYLVASDAIGMGLNLSVKRIIFNSINKFDGVKRVQLTIPQIKQIAGRAGRYRSAHQDKTQTASTATANASSNEENVGLVTCLDEEDLPIIQAALKTEPPPLRRAGIVAPAEFLEEYSQRLPVPVPFEFLLRKVSETATLHPRFFQCDIRDKLALARLTDGVKGLTIEQRVNITAAPSPRRSGPVPDCLTSLARVIAEGRNVDVSEVPEIPLEVLAQPPTADRSYLEALESLHQCLILFLWLSYRFVTNLHDKDMAMHAKAICEQKINWTLRAFSANPKLRERLRQLRREQKDLEEGHFNTGMPVEGQEETSINEAKPDGPAEVYGNTEILGQGGGLQGHNDDDAFDLMPRIEDFGAGEHGLDLGQHDHEHRVSTSPQKQWGPSLDGDSALDIARPRDEKTTGLSSSATQEAYSGSDASNELITPFEEVVLDKGLEREDKLIPDPEDAKSSNDSSNRKPGELPTAKGPQGEYVDPDALGEEIEEGEKLRGSAGT